MTFVRQSARWLVTTILVAGIVAVPWRLHANIGDSLLTTMAGGVYIVVAAAGIWQMWRICVTLTPSKVIVRNPWRDHHITWDRIADIERESVLGRQRISLVLTDGSSVPCAVYSGMSLSNAPLGEEFFEAVRQRIGSVER